MSLNKYIGNGTQIDLDQFISGRLADFGLAVGASSLPGSPNIWFVPDLTIPFIGMNSKVPIPIFGSQEVDITRSQDILEFRSDGNVFMAQQEGGRFGTRIRLKLMDNYYSTVIIAILKYLLKAQGPKERDENFADVTEMEEYAKTKDIETYTETGLEKISQSKPGSFTNQSKRGFAVPASSIKPGGVLTENIYTQGLFSSAAGASYMSVPPQSDVTAINSTRLMSIEDEEGLHKKVIEGDGKKTIEITAEGDFSSLKTTWHRTMTVSTKYEILFDMYIETLVISRIKNAGSNIINVTINLRRFDPPPILQESEIVGVRKEVGVWNKKKHKCKTVLNGIARKNTYIPAIDTTINKNQPAILYKSFLGASTTIGSNFLVGISEKDPRKTLDSLVLGSLYTYISKSSGYESFARNPEVIDLLFNTNYQLGRSAFTRGIMFKRHKTIHEVSVAGF